MAELTERSLLLSFAKFQHMHNWKPNWLVVPPELETAARVLCRHISPTAPFTMGSVAYNLSWRVQDSLASDEWFVTWSDDV